MESLIKRIKSPLLGPPKGLFTIHTYRAFLTTSGRNLTIRPANKTSIEFYFQGGVNSILLFNRENGSIAGALPIQSTAILALKILMHSCILLAISWYLRKCTLINLFYLKSFIEAHICKTNRIHLKKFIKLI